MIATQEIQFGIASQSLRFDCPDGRPSSITSCSVYRADADDTSTAESATTGSPAVEANPNTTTSAACGAGQSDPTAISLTSTTGVAVGRRFRLTSASGFYEEPEIIAVSGATAYVRSPLINAYPSGSTFAGSRCTQALSDTWVADLTRLSPACDPNGTYRVRWVVVVNGATQVYDRYFDLVRYPMRHNVAPEDVEEASPGWKDSLPTDDRDDIGRRLIDRAAQLLKRELYQDKKADQALRNTELVAELVIARTVLYSVEIRAGRGEVNPIALEQARNQWRQVYDGTIRAPVARVDTAGGGASHTVRPTPLWRR